MLPTSFENNDQLADRYPGLNSLTESAVVEESTTNPNTKVKEIIRKSRALWLILIVIILVAGLTLVLRRSILEPNIISVKSGELLDLDQAEAEGLLVGFPEETLGILTIGSSSKRVNSNRGKSACWTPSGNIAFASTFTGKAHIGPFEFDSDRKHDMLFGIYDLPKARFKWIRPLGSAVSRDMILGIAADSSNNLLITGHFGGTSDFGGKIYQANGKGNIGSNDFFVAKYDTAGQLLWMDHAGGQMIPNLQTGNNTGLAITGDLLNNIFVTGTYIGEPQLGVEVLPAGGPNEETFLAKYDPDGRLDWVKTITNDYMVYAFDLASDQDGAVYLTGDFGHHNLGGSAYFEADTLTSWGGRDIFLAKYTADGDLSWIRQAGSSVDTNGYDSARNLAIDSNGNCFIAGQFVGAAVFGRDTLFSYGGRDIFLAKYSQEGDLIWARQAGNSGEAISQNEGALAIATTRDGSVLTTGSFSGKARFGSFILETGQHNNCFIAKYSSDGVPIWVKKFEPLDGFVGASGNEIQVNESGHFVVTGYFSGRIQIDGITLESKGKEDIFILLFNTDGQLVSAKNFVYAV